jgi:hypothetical protein
MKNPNQVAVAACLFLIFTSSVGALLNEANPLRGGAIGFTVGLGIILFCWLMEET